MKKKTAARILCLGLCALLTFPFVSCGKKKGSVMGELADASNAKNATFKMVKEIKGLNFDVKNMNVCGDKIFFFGENMNMGGDDYGEETYDEGAAEEEVSDDTETEEGSESEDMSPSEGPLKEGEEDQTADEETVAEEPVEEEPAEEETVEEALTEEEIGEFEEPYAGEEGMGEGMEEEVPIQDKISYHASWAICDIEGNVQSTGDYQPKHGNTYLQRGVLLSDNSIVILESKYEADEVSENGIYYIKIGTDGTEQVCRKIPDVEYIQEDNTLILDDGSLFLNVDNNILSFDKNLNQVGKVDAGSMDYLQYIFTNAQGELMAYGLSGGYFKGYKADFKAQNLSDPFDLTEAGRFKNGPGYDFYTASNTGIFGYDSKTKEEKMLMNYLDSDLINNMVRDYCIIDEKNFILTINNADTGSQIPTLYTKVNPEDVKDKTIITLGGVYIGYSDISKKVLEFNRSNDSYRIRTFDYGQYNTSDDYSLAEKQFRNDILTNSGPDIIVTSGLTNPSTYINKGVFADMYPLMEKAGVDRNDFMENVLEAGSKDGHLYTFIPNFTVFCLITKQEYLDGKPGLSFRDAMNLEQRYNATGGALPYGTREELIGSTMMMSGNEFYNVVTGECNFDSQGFMDLVEFTKTYGDDTSRFEAPEYMDEQVAVAMHKVLYKGYTFSSFRDFNREDHAVWGEDAALCGFFSSDGNSSGVIQADLGFAISNLSKHQDAAFSFIKMFMEEDYQMPSEDESYSYSFPSLKKALDKYAEKAMEKPFYYDEHNKKVEYNESYYNMAKNRQVEFDCISDERMEYCKKFILNASRLPNYDQSIINLVKEETAAYYSGQKSVEDVCNVIQSRVSIYVKENQ